MLDENIRYLQIAFNQDLHMAVELLPQVPPSHRILIEAGTPFIKQEGMAGIRKMRNLWPGLIVADMKVSDGAINEVQMAHIAGANAITALGSAPMETLNLFIGECRRLRMISMVDMIAVKDPLNVIRLLPIPPDVVVLHLGRDEESSRGKLIQYRHVNRIHSKYPALISAAGGMDIKAARSAIFNGANIVVANIVEEGDCWRGISVNEDIGAVARMFLETIE